LKPPKSGKPREPSAEDLILGFAQNVSINQMMASRESPHAEDLILGQCFKMWELIRGFYWYFLRAISCASLG